MIARNIIATVIVLVGNLAAFANENWPQWRGPRGDGIAASAGPIHWDGPSGKHIRWKAALPGQGHSSPIVWNDRVFVTACEPESMARVLVCVDRASGRVLWQSTALHAFLESKHALNSYASSTPATDGTRVYVSFLEPHETEIWAPNVGSERKIHPGTIVVAAFDLNGNQLWVSKPGPFISAHGFCSNPIVYGDLVLLNGDHDGEAYLFALDKSSGSLVWKQPRRHKTRSYSTLLIRSFAGREQMILAGSKCVASFDPSTGRPIWHVEGPTEQFVASVVDDGTRIFAVGGYPTHHVIAIEPDGTGDVTQTHVAWHVTSVRCYVPSPVVVDQYLIVADDRGTANCFDTRSGDRLWQARMGKHYSASLVAADGLVYMTADDGETKVIRPGPTPQVVAENRLGDQVRASPAIVDGQLFIRGTNGLYCIDPQDDQR